MKSLVSFLLLACLISGCSRGPVGFKFGSDEGSSPDQREGKADSSGPIVGFDEVNAKVFSKYCQSCHGGDKSPLMNNYQTYRAQLSDVYQDVVVKKSMPKKQALSDVEIALVKKWIDQGAQEKGSVAAVPDEPVPETELVTFDRIYKEFYQAKCTSCHYPGNPEQRNDYATFDKFRDNIGTIIATTHIYITMPPPPSEELVGDANPNQLTRAEKELINRWVLDGQKEN